MKHVVAILLTICFLTGALFFSGGSLLAQEASELQALRQQNDQLKKLVEDLQKELEQVRLEMESQMLRAASEAEAKDEELGSMERLREGLAEQMQDQLKANEQYLQAFEQLQKMQSEKLQPQVEKELDAALRAVKEAKKLENVEVPDKMEEFLREKTEEFLREFVTERPDAREAKKAREILAELQKQKLAQALKVLRDRMLSQLAQQGDISEKAKNLEESILSKDDMGLLTQLRFEKVDLCRKLGRLDEAVEELEEIIEESLDTMVRTSARWMLIELLQESGKTDEALHELKNMLEATADPKERRSILYAIIQMAGDDPEARLRATEEVIDWLEENVQKAQEEAREKGERARCAANLKQLVLAMTMWSIDHKDEFPEKLSVLYPTYVTDLSVFTCPSQHGPTVRQEEIDQETSYILRRPPTDTPPSQEVVLYEDPSNHGGDGGNAAFADAHVEWLDAARLKKIAASALKVGAEALF